MSVVRLLSICNNFPLNFFNISREGLGGWVGGRLMKMRIGNIYIY